MERIKMKKRWLIFGSLLAAATISGLAYVRIQLNDGFTINRIRSEGTIRKEWSVESPLSYRRREVEHILAQPFTYLNKGAQSYAFLSEDGNYVLKFFKQQHLRPRTWLEALPLTGALDRWRTEAVDRRRDRKTTLFGSYKLACERLAEETGILYLHLDRSQVAGLQTTLLDKCGCEHTVQLDDVEFVIQSRGVLVRSCIDRAVEAGDTCRAYRVLDGVLKLIDCRTRKGFIDGDPAFLQNYGVVGDAVIQFDAGTVQKSDSALTATGYAQELVRSTDQLRHWLSHEHPDLVKHLDHELWRLIAKRETEQQTTNDGKFPA